MIYIQLTKDNKVKRFKTADIDMAFALVKKCTHVKHIIISDQPNGAVRNYDAIIENDLNDKWFIERRLNNWLS